MGYLHGPLPCPFSGDKLLWRRRKMAGFGYVGTPEQVHGWLMEAMEILEPLGAESPQDTARRVKSDAQNWRNSLPDRGRVVTNEHYSELCEKARKWDAANGL